MNKIGIKRAGFCPGCGEEILVIKTGTLVKSVMVEAETVWIRQETNGDEFVTADGRILFGREAGDADDDPDANLMPAHIPHKGRCPNRGRARRKRERA